MLHLTQKISCSCSPWGHHGDIAASVRIHPIFALPIFLSGLPSLVLTNVEIELIDTYLESCFTESSKFIG
jgi:hypothetical protein